MTGGSVAQRIQVHAERAYDVTIARGIPENALLQPLSTADRHRAVLSALGLPTSYQPDVLPELLATAYAATCREPA